MTHTDDDSVRVTRLHLEDEAATLALGVSLAPYLRPAMRVYLSGDLGSGKTTLVRGLLWALGHEGSVKSPTYSLVELYVVSSLNLYHFDFYRLKQAEEYLDAGLDEYFRGRGVCLVEWPEQAGGLLPPADVHIEFELEQSGRCARILARTAKGFAWLEALPKAAANLSTRSPPPR